MQKIITSLTGKYGLTKPEVMTEIEAVFSSMLSRWYRLQVMVFFRADLCLEAVAYNDSGGVIMQKVIDFCQIKGRKTILRYIEDSLAKAAVLKETAIYKNYEKEWRWGEIVGRDQEGNLLVETEVVLNESVIAVCPLNRIGIHERNSVEFSAGRKRAFHLRRVEPISLNGTPRLKVIVDRVSKTLVENLLKSHLGAEAEKVRLRCVKRYVGHKSIILTTKPLSKKAIIAVDRELKERVQVKIVRALPGK
ncbi:MAG: hypothetical protein AB1545_08855 [Thermodesulfobacteriota bacterium]